MIALQTLERFDLKTDYDRIAVTSVLVFGDDPVRRRRLAAVAIRYGARVVGEASIADAAARLEMQAGGHILVDLATDAGEDLDRLLERLEVWGSLGVTVIATPALIDVVAAYPGLIARLLIAPDDGEILEAIDAVVEPPPAAVRDGGGETSGRKLQDLRDELARIANAIAGLSGSIDVARPELIERKSANLRSAAARAEIRRRRLRNQFFDPTLFADPAWDMLLDLAAAGNERRRVAVSSLCIAAAVPSTTALRWIAQMTEQGLLLRDPDPDDRRRVFVALSDTARTAMDRYLDAVSATG